MRPGISLIAAGHATSLMLAVTFALCVAFDLVFPGMAMYQVWLKLLPGFEWLSWRSFALGLAESYAYGWYFALVWVPIYNFASRRARTTDGDAWSRRARRSGTGP